MAKELVMSDQLKSASDKLVEFIGYNPIVPVFQKANVVLAVREFLAVPEARAKIMALQGTEAGFVTDMDDKGGYDERTVCNAVTVGLVNGFQLINNEINIIAGKFYGAKNGYKRKCKEFENDRFKALHVGDPDNGDILETPTMVTIPMSITYTLLDKETQQKVTKTMRKRIQFTKKSRDTVDAWLGKGAKRLYQRLISELTGMEFNFDEPAGDGVIKEDHPEVGKRPLRPTPDKPDAADAEFSPAESTAQAAETAVPTPEQEPATASEGEPAPGEDAPAALNRGKRPPAKNERF